MVLIFYLDFNHFAKVFQYFVKIDIFGNLQFEKNLANFNEIIDIFENFTCSHLIKFGIHFWNFDQLLINY